MSSYGITSDVRLAAQVLQDGGIVGMPTETVYGLAALARNEQAVSRVFDTKGRPRNHPLIVHVSSLDEAMNWGVFNDSAIALAQAFWPGPLTLLLPRTSIVPDWVTGGRDTVAIRVPSHSVAQELLRAVSDGVVAPSANKFGKVSPTTALHVRDDLGDDVDLILEGGQSEVGIESTIVESTDSFQILRPGKISFEEIARVVHQIPNATEGPSRAPGMLESHYAPDAHVVIVESLDSAQNEIAALSHLHSTRLLYFEDVNEYAEKLYQELRRADRDGIQTVIAVSAPSIGIGSAVNDRLAKAAAHRSSGQSI